MTSRLNKAGEDSSPREIIELACDRLQRDYSEDILNAYEEILQDDWYDSCDDLRVAILDREAWSCIKLPGRLKLEMKRIIVEMDEKDTSADVRVAMTIKDRKALRSPAGSASKSSTSTAKFVPRGDHSAPPAMLPPTPAASVPATSAASHTPVSPVRASASPPATTPAPARRWAREYSTDASAYYYADLRTGQTQWEKPSDYVDEVSNSYGSLISDPPQQSGQKAARSESVSSAYASASSEYYPALPTGAVQGSGSYGSNAAVGRSDSDSSYRSQQDTMQQRPSSYGQQQPSSYGQQQPTEREFDPLALTEEEMREQQELLNRFSKDMQRTPAPAIPPSALSPAYAGYGGGTSAQGGYNSTDSLGGSSYNAGSGFYGGASELQKQTQYSSPVPPAQYQDNQYQQQYPQQNQQHYQQQPVGAGGYGNGQQQGISYGPASSPGASGGTQQYGNPAIPSGNYSGYGNSSGYGAGSTIQSQRSLPPSSSGAGASPPKGAVKAPSASAFTQSVNQLVAMGFESKAASKALIDCQFDVQAAATVLSMSPAEPARPTSARSTTSSSSEGPRSTTSVSDDPTAAGSSADSANGGKAKSKVTAMKNLFRGVGLGSKKKSVVTGMMAEGPTTVEAGTATPSSAPDLYGSGGSGAGGSMPQNY